jgi:hypothetical protein
MSKNLIIIAKQPYLEEPPQSLFLEELNIKKQNPTMKNTLNL